MKLIDRLEGVALILRESHQDVATSVFEDTGYVAADPSILIKSIMSVMDHADATNTSLDLGCGDGSWVLLMAAAGYRSCGIEINPLLLDRAQQNLIRAIRLGFIDEAKCTLIHGDMMPIKFSESYDAYRKSHDKHPNNMPIGPIVNDAYQYLPVSIATADIIYCWAWPTQSRFVFNMLEEEAKEDAIFVLPSYIRYTQGEFLKDMEEKNTLFLAPLLAEGESFVGKRAGILPKPISPSQKPPASNT